jgi:hypothetical protein
LRIADCGLNADPRRPFICADPQSAIRDPQFLSTRTDRV